MTGTITTWSGQGYGWISPSDGGGDVFVFGHFRRGDRVAFDMVPNDRRPGQMMATNVTLIQQRLRYDRQRHRSPWECRCRRCGVDLTGEEMRAGEVRCTLCRTRQVQRPEKEAA